MGCDYFDGFVLGVLMADNLKMNFDGHSLITPEAMTNEIFAGSIEESDTRFDVAKQDLLLSLTLVQQLIDSGAEPQTIVHRTAGVLHHLRHKFHPSIWRELIPVVQDHSTAEYFRQDPFTRWSFEKPRGYSGDAQLLDFIYGHPSVDDYIAQSSAVGLEIYDYTKEASSSVAVRERRDILTSYVDKTAMRCLDKPEVLAIAAGQLREANASVALREGRLERWVALDQDSMSIGSITRDFAGTAIEAIDGSVRSILSRHHNLGQFDLVYAAGLYDYLIDKVAIKLTERCLEMLKPGGQFLFANFAEDITVDGYMETYMNWALLLRTEEDMWRIIHAVADPAEFTAEVFFGENRNIVYGVIRRRG
jgi:SAM-dependent methyltransferase